MTTDTNASTRHAGSACLAWTTGTSGSEATLMLPVPALGSDKGLRQRWFPRESFGHPAKLHLGFLQWALERYTRPGQVIGDPMAGVGSLLLAAASQRNVIARELEDRWVAHLCRNAAYLRERAALACGEIDVGQGDARVPWGWQADHLLFSPPYGNEASTTDTAHRHLPYRLRSLGVPLDERWRYLAERPSAGAMGALAFFYGRHPQQVGHLRGKRYLAAMREVYTQAKGALRPGGRLMLVLRDHIRDGQRVPTAELTVALCEELGFALEEWAQRHLESLSLWPRLRRERGLPVVEQEDLLVFRHAQQETPGAPLRLSPGGSSGARAREQER